MQLMELQEILLQVLLDIDRLCRENNITYYLAGGTLLGAVRHKGFIPWDDDVDLMMTREQYDRFLIIAHKHLPKQYFLQCSKFDPEWKYEYAKIRINDTFYPTRFSEKFKNLHQGIFVDVFVQDKTSEYRPTQFAHAKKIQLWHAIVRYKWLKKEFPGMKIRAKWFVKGAGAYTSLMKAKKNYLKMMKKYSNRPTKYLLDSSGMNLKRGAYLSEWLNPPVMIEFEGHKFPCPHEYGKYLEYLYGKDYMIPIQKIKHGIEPSIE